MSNDLISRSTLIEEFYKRIGGDLTFEEVEYEECKQIMESPVQQDCYGEECKVGDCTVCAFDKALDIVKAGEING